MRTMKSIDFSENDSIKFEEEYSNYRKQERKD